MSGALLVLVGYLGLLLLMRARLTSVPIPIRLDPLVCGLAMAGLAVALGAGPLHAAADRAPQTVVVGLFYPWGDLVLLALACVAVAFLLLPLHLAGGAP